MENQKPDGIIIPIDPGQSSLSDYDPSFVTFDNCPPVFEGEKAKGTGNYK